MKWYCPVSLSLYAMPFCIRLARLLYWSVNDGLMITSRWFMAHQTMVFIISMLVVTLRSSIAGCPLRSVMITLQAKGRICCGGSFTVYLVYESLTAGE